MGVAVAAHRIVPMHVFVIQQEPPMGLAAFRFQFGAVLVGQLQGRTVVNRRFVPGQLQLALGVQLFRSFVAGIQTPGLTQLGGGLFIAVQPVGLAGIHIPCGPQPGQIAGDGLGIFRFGALGIGVVVAQDETSALRAGKQPIDQGDAGIAHMQHAGGGRGETKGDGRSAHRWAVNPLVMG